MEENKNFVPSLTLIYEDDTPVTEIPSVSYESSCFQKNTKGDSEIFIGPFQFNVCSYKNENKKFKLLIELHEKDENDKEKLIFQLISKKFLIKSKRPIIHPGIKSNPTDKKQSGVKRPLDCKSKSSTLKKPTTLPNFDSNNIYQQRDEQQTNDDIPSHMMMMEKKDLFTTVEENFNSFFEDSPFIQEEKISFLNDALDNYTGAEKIEALNGIMQYDNEIDLKSIFEETFLSNNNNNNQHLNEFENTFKYTY